MFHRDMHKVLWCASFVLWCAASYAADWPQFRGPDRDDVSRETDLLKQWPSGGPALAWKTGGLGGGFSGLSIVGNKLFTMGDSGGGMYAIALDLATQKPLWKTKIGPEYKNPNGDGPRCTPTADGDLVFVLSPQGELACLRVADGSIVWHKNLETEFGGVMMSRWGYSESPLVDGPNVICTPGGTKGSVLALNKKTGAFIWQSVEITDKASYSSLLPVTIGGVRQYIQLSDAHVYAVAADTGKLLWSASRPGRVAVIPTSIYKDGIVFVTSGYSVGHNAFKITTAGGSFKIAPLYAGKELANHHGGVVLVGDYVYGFSDTSQRLLCMELKTGKVLWQNPCVGKGSLTCADGHLYVRSEKGPGAIALVEASPAGYKETGRFDQPDRSSLNSWVHPVVCDGKLYIRDQDLLLCYRVKQ